MVEIWGERNRKVPVIITPDLQGVMEVLPDTEKREKSYVNERNQYVFPVNDGKSLNNLRGNDVMRYVCSQVKLENASAITSTNLRKYVAPFLSWWT